ncbi:MAG: winged helix-turn-helix domain-containing protein [Candidatus Dormiibacterota bacterium]
MAARLKGQLGVDDIDVVWHRQASGLLREPVADAIVLDGVDLIDATVAVRRATAAWLLVVGPDERVAATCLAIGADAWLPSGSASTLVGAQVRALLRKRISARVEAVIEAGRLRLDVGARLAKIEGREVELKPREFDLLRVFVENRGVALSRDRILAGAWGSRFVGEPKTVDVHVAWLRPKLERSGLRVTTLRGVGYRLDVLEDRRPHVLFVCVQNAGRSQMAAALFNRHAQGLALADSAGTRPAARVHPEVVKAMRELGVDLGSARPQLMTPEIAAGAVRVVTMGCGEGECPVVNVPTEDWRLPDPAGQPVEVVRLIRDEIDHRVRSLLASLEA